MDNRTIATILCAGLALALPALAQREPSLDKKIEQALAMHPEILMAEAKVRQADAELRIARLKVTQQVIQLNASQEAQRRLVASMRQQVQRARALVENGTMTVDEFAEGERKLIEAESQLAQIDAEARFVLGADLAAAARVEAEPKLHGRPPVPTAFASHMTMEVDVDFEETPIDEVVKALSSAIDANRQPPTMKLVLDRTAIEDEFGSLEDLKVTLKKGKAPLSSALAMIADTTSVRFVFRDYGILVTTEWRATGIDAAAIPIDLPLSRGAKD